MEFSEEQKKDIESMRQNGMGWNKIARIYGLSFGASLRYWVDEQFREKTIRDSRLNKQRRKEKSLYGTNSNS